MKRTVPILIVAVTLLAAPFEASALGEADGQWFKIVYRTKNGLQVDKKTGEISRGGSTDVCYTRLVYTPNSNRSLPGIYLGDIICEPSPGVFKKTGRTVDFYELPGGKMAYAEHDHNVYTNVDGHYIRSLGNGMLKIRTDKHGDFIKGTFRSLAAALDGSSLDGTSRLLGGLTVRGTSIHEAELPFTP